MSKINPEFSKKINKFGAFDLNACYNCGNCTAVCSLSTKENSFPREMVRYSVLGLEDDIKGSLKPWLCYYCGECSTHCPQTANPGELMMSLRRWLTAKYDWTGLSGLLYKSLPISLMAFILVLAGVIFYAFKMDFNQESIMHFGHYFEMFAIGAVFLFILVPNIARMWYFTVLKDKPKIKFGKYFKVLGSLFIHMFTQKQTLGCDESRSRWFLHLVLVFGYLTLLATTVALDWFGTDNSIIIALGYIEAFLVFSITIIFMLGRISKTREMSKFSQPSDIFFIVWLFLMGLTAFAVRLFIDLDLLTTNFWLYLAHLTILAQWAIIIVPFGKWTHFLYRSFAMYFEELKAQK